MLTKLVILVKLLIQLRRQLLMLCLHLVPHRDGAPLPILLVLLTLIALLILLHTPLRNRNRLLIIILQMCSDI